MWAPRAAVARRARTGRPNPVAQEDERGQVMGRFEWERLGSIRGLRHGEIVPFATPDGCHIAFVAQKGDKQLVVVDGELGPEFDGIDERSLVFSPDGKRMAYVARKGDKWLVVVDGKTGPAFDGISQPVFSPDGKRIAYAAQKGDKWRGLVDGQAGPEFDWIGKGTLVFSADGKRLAYAARKGFKCFVVVDGEAGPEVALVLAGPAFLRDGRLEYIALKDKVLYRVTERPPKAR